MGLPYEKQRPWRGDEVIALALAAALGLAPLPGSAITQERSNSEDLQQPIDYAYDSGLVDYKNKTGDFKRIVVSQGTMRIQADRAHAVGLDEMGFGDGRWTFQGNVRIDAEPRGTLRSDEAVVEIRDKRIATATATGKPAEFQQRRPGTGQLARGHADLIVYDVGKATVKLSKDAWLTTDGQNQISGPQITYSIRDQRVEANSSRSDARVHLTIVPHGSLTPGKGETPKLEPRAVPKPNP
jgi:lipopolysaccharide transport protein LptA